MKRYLSFLIMVFNINLVLLSLVYADSNGVWNYAKDLRFGVLGLDEEGFGLDGYEYIFNNSVSFLKNILGDFNVSGNLYVNGSMVSTLDENGKIPLSQLPFHKGDLLAPANRLNISGVDDYYFDISGLEVDKELLLSKWVSFGVKFGINNSISGTFTSDATAISNNIVEGTSAYVKGVKVEGTLPLSSICSTAGVGGTADCSNSVSVLEPGVFYAMIGSNKANGTNYCDKFIISNNGSISNEIIKTAGICKKISICNSTSQNISNYPDGTICDINKECIQGLCVNKKISPNSLNIGSKYPVYHCAGAGWESGYIEVRSDGIKLTATALWADYKKNTYNYYSFAEFPLTDDNYPIIVYSYGRDSMQIKVDPNTGDIMGRCKTYDSWNKIASICTEGTFDGEYCILG